MKRFGLAALMTATAALPALAQETDKGRFQLERTDSGSVVRLDTQSGALTLCNEKDGNLVCRMAADERAAYEEELDRLEKRVDALETAPSDRQSGDGRTADALPSDADIDRTFTIMEKMMRRFMGLAKELDKEQSGGDSFPDRT